MFLLQKVNIQKYTFKYVDIEKMSENISYYDVAKKQKRVLMIFGILVVKVMKLILEILTTLCQTTTSGI